MSYATRSDLEALFGANDVAEMVLRHADGDAAIATALEHASQEIDSWVASRYHTPFAEAPAAIQRICCVITRYNLWGRNLDESHPVYVAYRDEIRVLKAIAAGEITMPAAQLNADAPISTRPAKARSRRRQFGADVLDRMP